MSNKEFTKGDTEPSGDCGMYAAGIDHLTPDADLMKVGGMLRTKPGASVWMQRIVVYGHTPTEAEAVRDRLLAALDNETKYQHGSPLHKEVFMALDSYTGGDDFETGVRNLIAELKDRRATSRKQRIKTCAALKERNDARKKLADIRNMIGK